MSHRPRRPRRRGCRIPASRATRQFGEGRSGESRGQKIGQSGDVRCHEIHVEPQVGELRQATHRRPIRARPHQRPQFGLRVVAAKEGQHHPSAGGDARIEELLFTVRDVERGAWHSRRSPAGFPASASTSPVWASTRTVPAWPTRPQSGNVSHTGTDQHGRFPPTRVGVAAPSCELTSIATRTFTTCRARNAVMGSSGAPGALVPWGKSTGGMVTAIAIPPGRRVSVTSTPHHSINGDRTGQEPLMSHRSHLPTFWQVGRRGLRGRGCFTAAQSGSPMRVKAAQ